MFIKFSGKIVDVSNCYIEQDQSINTDGETNIDVHRILLCSLTAEAIEEDVFLLSEEYLTKVEADKRFAELEAALTSNPIVDAINNYAERIEHIEGIKFSEQLYNP